jgi:hypothetical protein
MAKFLRMSDGGHFWLSQERKAQCLRPREPRSRAASSTGCARDFRGQIYLLETPICRTVGEIGAKIDNQTKAACN